MNCIYRQRKEFASRQSVSKATFPFSEGRAHTLQVDLELAVLLRMTLTFETPAFTCPGLGLQAYTTDCIWLVCFLFTILAKQGLL